MPIDPMGAVYNNPSFKDKMNIHYHSVDAMRNSIDKLKKSGQVDLATMEFGQYQPILAPNDVNPIGAKTWLQNVGYARLQLSAQPNDRPLSKDEPTVIPLTKCALLDASIRKCFNSNPPIPMQIDVTQKPNTAPDWDKHDILLVWDYGAGNVPTLLYLTMVCPYIPTKFPKS